VVVPAHDEQDRIGRCLSSLRRALAQVPDGVSTAVAIVLDRCTDATPQRVAALVADWPQASVLTVTSDRAAPSPNLAASTRPGLRGVGAVRDLGLQAVLDRLSGHPAAGTWLLSTDADTTVPPDWVRAHLRHAADGVHAVAGLADLATTDQLATGALWRYRAIVEHGLHGATHHHVYGANLGVRADAYLAVGGFPADGSGEDHRLWRRLAVAGYTLVQPVGIRVRTSARLRGRADGGLAGLLRALHHDDRRADHRDDQAAGHRAGDAVCDGA
jgi:cellulose synthase/poly-beta-1,6-N-acetylglucosamine synthase-like glycosyltransferase